MRPVYLDVVLAITTFGVVVAACGGRSALDGSSTRTADTDSGMVVTSDAGAPPGEGGVVTEDSSVGEAGPTDEGGGPDASEAEGGPVDGASAEGSSEPGTLRCGTDVCTIPGTYCEKFVEDDTIPAGNMCSPYPPDCVNDPTCDCLLMDGRSGPCVDRGSGQVTLTVMVSP